MLKRRVASGAEVRLVGCWG